MENPELGNQIFLPMYYMVWLTILVFLLSTCVRLKEIYINKIEWAIDGEQHRPVSYTHLTLPTTNSV